MVVQPSVQPMLLSCTFRITELHCTYVCPTLIEAYICMFYLQNYWVTLHLLGRYLKWSLC